MMKMYRRLRMLSKHSLLFLTVLFVVLNCLPVAAQNATISPKLGNLISAYTHQSSEVGFESGYGSLWQHKQLPITYSCSDFPTLSKDGVLGNHTCNLLYYTKNGREKMIQVVGPAPNYTSLALPKGYRITRYKIIISDSLDAISDYSVLDGRIKDLKYGRYSDWYFGEVAKKDIRPNSEAANYQRPNYRNGAYVRIARTAQKKSYTIERKGEDMGNILYFCFSGNTHRLSTAGIAYDSIQIWFTADKEIECTLLPNVEHENYVSLSENVMTLGKTDVGNLKLFEKRGTKYYGYDQKHSLEMTASINLFEEGATDGETWDATRGNKTIKCVKSNDAKGDEWYALRSGTFYIEAPTSARVQGESKNVRVPVGYRITGVKFDYKTDQYKKCGFRLRNGNTYLDSELKGVARENAAIWHRTSYNELYTLVDGAPKYLSYQMPWEPGYIARAKLTDENKHVRLDENNNSFYLYIKRYEGTESKFWLSVKPGETAYFTETRNQQLRVDAVEMVDNSTPFRLITYDKKGNYRSTVDVSDETGGDFELRDYNNDAIKFRIEGTSHVANPTALLRITLYMEALNPYINTVNVVCNGKYNKVVRTFEAQDFNLGGEKFVYKVPKGLSDQTKVQFSFDSLKSEFADETYGYPHIPHHSRYSFVGSDYYKALQDRLYDHVDLVENCDYGKKISVSAAGNIAFPFNNAGELSNTNKLKPSAYFSEKPFTLDVYSKTEGEEVTIIDGQVSKKKAKGNFSPTNAQLQNKETKTMYLYTTDETRYNIAPTKGEQHRSFAYYQTTIKLEFASYTARIKWVPLYNKPMYDKDDAHKRHLDDKMFGAEIQTIESGVDGNKPQEGATSEFGFLSLNQIIEALEDTIRKDGGVNGPKSLKEVLYIDGSKLFDILPVSQTQDLVHKLDSLRGLLASNALIYLPYRSKTLASVPNTALKYEGKPGFEGRNNLVLVDKMPFFAPYDIQLRPECYASYTRNIAPTFHGRVDYATLVLPYGLTVDKDGIHETKGEEESKFYMGKIAKESVVYNKNDKRNHEGADYGDMTKLEKLKAGKSEANQPYVIKVLSGHGAKNVFFVANEKGALIKKTPEALMGLVASDAVSCKITNVTTSLKSYFTYSGRKISKSGNEMVFYFSLNRFVAFKNLSKDDLFLYPFRSVYYADNHKVLQSKGFNSFGVSFDDVDDITPTAIQDVQEEVVLKVTLGAGHITAEASKDISLNVFNLSGQCVVRTLIKAGKPQTFYLAPGVYLVNGKKMIVN